MKNDPRSCEHNLFVQLRKKPEKKIQDFNGIWTRDLAIPLRRFNHLSQFWVKTHVFSTFFAILTWFPVLGKIHPRRAA